MWGFLIQNGVLNPGIVCSVFTNTLMMSFKTNIIDPCSHHIAPQHYFCEDDDDREDKIKWKLFARDLIMWLCVIIIIFLIYTHVLNKNTNPVQQI